MTLGKSPTQYLGVQAKTPPNIIRANRAPTVNDKAYAFGDIWINDVANACYQNAGGGVWIVIGTATTGLLQVLAGTTGGDVNPVGGKINLLGNPVQGLSFAGSPGTLTGTIADWTTTQKGVGVLATNAQAITGTGTTQAVTPAALTARLASPGPIGATAPAAGTFTTLTATAGNIVATNGNVSLSTPGKKIVIATGANASVGTSGPMVAGSILVSTTASSATAKVFYVRAITGGDPGHVSITSQNAAGFTLTSSSPTETSTFNWWIINA